MDFSSKLSLYDTLTMMLSGFLILFITGVFESRALMFEEWYIVTLCLVACYIVGMIYHRILECLLRCFCSCPRDCKCHLFRSFCRNDEKMIRKAYEGRVEENEDIKEKYYLAYYRLAKNGCLGNIPVLEAQEAFLRDMVLIVLLYTICVCFDNAMFRDILGEQSRWYCIVIIGIAVLFAILCIHSFVQRKIYELVWEGDKYLCRLDKNEELSSISQQVDEPMEKTDQLASV